jgi:hypothetical protein
MHSTVDREYWQTEKPHARLRRERKLFGSLSWLPRSLGTPLARSPAVADRNRSKT